MILITGIHIEGDEDHKNITQYKWKDTKDNSTGITNKEKMVKYVEDYPGVTYVQNPEDKDKYIEVLVVNDKPKYLRTKANNTWTDNLLKLPQF